MSPVAAQVRLNAFCLMCIHLVTLYGLEVTRRNTYVSAIFRCLCLVKFTLSVRMQSLI